MKTVGIAEGSKLADIQADDDSPALGNGHLGRDSIVDEDSMLTTCPKRLAPPFSGQVQIAEIERARALVMRSTERLVITTADFPVSAFVSVRLP